MISNAGNKKYAPLGLNVNKRKKSEKKCQTYFQDHGKLLKFPLE